MCKNKCCCGMFYITLGHLPKSRTHRDPGHGVLATDHVRHEARQRLRAPVFHKLTPLNGGMPFNGWVFLLPSIGLCNHSATYI